jgi:hypothetical protein
MNSYRKVFVEINNEISTGYIIKKIDAREYLVFVESIQKTLQINKNNIKNLDLAFR